MFNKYTNKHIATYKNKILESLHNDTDNTVSPELSKEVKNETWKKITKKGMKKNLKALELLRKLK